MNQHSEVIGSFLRNGQFPLEADYVFATEEELVQFYTEPENQAILHQGWFKVVGEGNEQALYWVVKENEELKFVKLLENIDRDTIYEDLKDIHQKLEQEIQDRENADNALDEKFTELIDTERQERIDSDNEIWGDKESLVDGLDDISKLSQNVHSLIIQLEELYKTTSSIIKGDDELTLWEFRKYLATLDYPSLEHLSKAVHKFLDTFDPEDDKINTLPELQEFLHGFTDKDKLYNILVDLWNAIEGTPTPNTQFRTLRGIQDFVEALASYTKNREDNLQSELDQTQVGVGLSGDGSYNADRETYYLKNATSVMNALKILDQEIHNLEFSVSTEVGNQIIIKPDGLYHNADIEYNDGTLIFKVNGNILRTYYIGLTSIVEDSYYDPSNEEIVIIFKLLNGDSQRIKIPAGALIREWEIDNSYPDKVVELTKVDSVGPGSDKLLADVRLSTDNYNILVKDGNTLLVDGRASNIIYDGDVTVESKIRELGDKDSEQQKQIDQLNYDLIEETTRAKEKEHDIEDALTAEQNRAQLAETTLQNSITNNTNNIENITSQLNNLQEDYNEYKVQVEKDKADINNSITELSGKVNSNQSSIEELKQNVSFNQEKIAETQQAIHAEEDRASKEEHRLEDLISGQASSISSLTEKVANIETIVSDMKSSVDEANSTAKEAKILAESFAADISNIKQTSQSLQEALNKEISDRAKEDKNLKESLEQLKSQFETIINKKLEPLIQRVEAIESTLTWNKHE